MSGVCRRSSAGAGAKGARAFARPHRGTLCDPTDLTLDRRYRLVVATESSAADWRPMAGLAGPIPGLAGPMPGPVGPIPAPAD